MTSLRVFLVSAVWLGSALGQLTFSPAGQPASAEKREVTGVVVNAATGEPVRKALVTLQTGNGQNAAFSDASGRFALEDVPEGMYGVQCQKPGYFGPGAGMAFQQIKVSSATDPLTVKLTPAASVSGRVVDDKGQPVENSSVQLLSESIVNGHKRWMPNQAGSSDEDGTYEIDNVQPGTYRLRLNMHPAPPFATAAQTPRSRMPMDVYPAQYFPQGADPSGAQAVVLQGGQTEHADFTVTAVPGFRVRGMAAPFKVGTFIRVEDLNGNDVGLGAGINGQSGKFVIAGVPSGAWRIVGQSFASEEQLWGEQLLQVNGSDLANVALHLEALANIPVEILGAPEGETPNLSLRLVRDDTSMDAAGWRQTEYSAMNANQGAEAGKPPALHFTNVLPGHYALRSQAYGNGACVDSVRSGTGDVERDGINVSAAQSSQPIQVSLRTDCASLQVKLNLPDGVQSASILVLSDNPSFEPRVMTVEGSGVFQFPNLSPGQYRLYAFNTTDQLEYANPEVLSAFQANEVTLDPNQKAEATLDVVKRATERSTADASR